MKTNILNKPVFHLLFISVLVLIAYSNTFKSSFHFDDEPVIVNNPIIKDLRYFIEPSEAEGFKNFFEYKLFLTRYVGYLSFALNYRLHGLHVTGYHVVNILIHIATSLLVYLFILLSFKTPYLAGSSLREHERHIAFLTALLFAVHPIQTQAVTYIFQRVTSLASMFYLFSIVMYIKWRLLTKSPERKAQSVNIKERKTIFRALGPAIFYLLSLVSVILAMKTKQIAITLPVILVCYEFIFFQDRPVKRFIYLIPMLLTMVIIPLDLVDLNQPLGNLIGNVNESTRGCTSNLTRLEYLFTSITVVPMYIRLIFLPINQNLDYDYPIYGSFFDIEVLASSVFLLAIIGGAAYIFYRYREKATWSRLIVFGAAMFFINLLLEQSIILLDNVVSEHRVYLPSIGVFMIVGTIFFIAISRLKKGYGRIKSAYVVILIMIITVLTGVTYARNSIWKNEVTLWQDVVKKSPRRARGYVYLGKAYSSQGLIDEAIAHYMTAIKLEPDYPNTYYNLGNCYMTKGETGLAIKYYLIAINLNPDLAEAYLNLGNAYNSSGRTKLAVTYYKTARKLRPQWDLPRINLRNIYTGNKGK